MQGSAYSQGDRLSPIEWKRNKNQAVSFLETNCIECHFAGNSDDRLDIESVISDLKSIDSKQSPQAVSAEFDHSLVARLEKILIRISTRQMPPPDESRPEERQYDQAIEAMSAMSYDRWQANPMTARSPALRRLTRYEYANAIRDLLGITIDVTELLPKDESSHGFDNITVDSLSPTLLTRYVQAAEKISRLAIAQDTNLQINRVVRIRPDRSQEGHVAGLPFGTRGGTQFEIFLPRSGEYRIQVKLMRDRDEKVEGLDAPHEMDILIDRSRVDRFKLAPPKSGKGYQRDYTNADAHLVGLYPINAGRHRIGVTFPRQSYSLPESRRQPFDTNYNRHRHPRRSPAVYQVTVTGPIGSNGTADSNPVRNRIVSVRPGAGTSPRDAARIILAPLLKRAYRREITADDFEVPMRMFQQAAKDGTFESGIELALAAILVNPNFLFRVESQSETATDPNGLVNLADFDIASRLSFFLWSSIPDDELLRLAKEHRLHQSAEIGRQVERMLRDPRSKALTESFLNQWLQLRNLDSITPDMRLFPDFDDNLRQDFKRETELLFQSIMERDLPVIRLIHSDETFLNERLAVHYGIPGILGDHFRTVNVGKQGRGGGILHHGSILTVTSYATRTSPTIRGNWVLKNILGTPPPPPPPNVPALKDKNTVTPASLRERLELHRKNPACNSCHRLMDPVGFAFENYDAVGRWRTHDGDLSIDSAGGFPDGTSINDVEELEAAILKHPRVFVSCLTRKLLTYALGRGMTPSDEPLIRKIVDRAAVDGFRCSSLIKNIVQSPLFLKQGTQ